MESEDKTSADVREGNPPASTKTEEPKLPAEGGTKAVEGISNIDDKTDGKTKKSVKEKCAKQHSKRKAKKAKKSKKAASPSDSSSDSDSDSSDSDSSSSSSDDSELEAEAPKKKRATKKRQSSEKTRKRSRAKKPKKAAESLDCSDSDAESVTSRTGGSEDSENDGNQRADLADLTKQLQVLILQQQQQQQQQGGGSYGYPSGLGNPVPPPPAYPPGLGRSPPRLRRGGARSSGRTLIPPGDLDGGYPDGKPHKDKKKRQKATKLDYKRVDQVWDDGIHNYKLQDTAEGTVDTQYDEFIFHVRRTFDWEGKYKATIVDIKSKGLRECLQEVIGDIKGVSLVDDTPKLDPNMLFLYVRILTCHTLFGS
jgi:hypothetical protein